VEFFPASDASVIVFPVLAAAYGAEDEFAA
jgi:hypothetical protein